MNESNRQKLQLALNKVCFSQDFKFFFISKHHFCPDGMTISVVGDPQGEPEIVKNSFYLALEIRHYGYEDSSNKGISKYDDLEDYQLGKFDFTKEHLDTVIDYFKTFKPELFEKYMDGVTFYFD